MSYTIGQVAQETGLSVHTLRFYEKEGILPPVKRNESSRRIYDSADIEWLKFACCLRDTGMTIDEMKKFAQLTIQGQETTKERITLLEEQKERINSQINQLLNRMSMIDYKIKFYSNNLG
ncbi:MerR family transcriptional regulator [Peribacillus cavernae]|uniref:MerR family transcriptional regulator n=1 Tax=Peribacillus cavernae TaxID=1674310 RepID=A0A3S0U7W8_9BACI|nr:MerR family transcriptional regulator [Peribacillus cavernae]MDQ0220342.1 DNA-binding transcriptional MerR regulator [Peribacillus cavernae]RUQ31990.1 MerR family transcriptional regulator [Peribacillus cavernae]